MNNENYYSQTPYYHNSNSYDFNKQQQSYMQYWNSYYYSLQNQYFGQQQQQQQQQQQYYYQDYSLNTKKQNNFLEVQQPLSTWIESDQSIISSPRNQFLNSNDQHSNFSSVVQYMQQQEQQECNQNITSNQRKISKAQNKRGQTKSLKKKRDILSQQTTTKKRKQRKSGGTVRKVGRPRKDERDNKKSAASQDIGVQNMVFQKFGGEKKIKKMEAQQIQIPGIKFWGDYGDLISSSSSSSSSSQQQGCQENRFLLNVQNCQEIKQVQLEQEITDDQQYQKRHSRCPKYELQKYKRKLAPNSNPSLKQKRYQQETPQASVIKICLNQEKVLFK